jgi:hypothetical protein
VKLLVLVIAAAVTTFGPPPLTPVRAPVKQILLHQPEQILTPAEALGALGATNTPSLGVAVITLNGLVLEPGLDYDIYPGNTLAINQYWRAHLAPTDRLVAYYY